MSLVHPFAFGAKVFADDDDTLPMIVTAFNYRAENYCTVECSYLANGDAKAAWIESWRLHEVKK